MSSYLLDELSSLWDLQIYHKSFRNKVQPSIILKTEIENPSRELPSKLSRPTSRKGTRKSKRDIITRPYSAPGSYSTKINLSVGDGLVEDSKLEHMKSPNTKSSDESIFDLVNDIECSRMYFDKVFDQFLNCHHIDAKILFDQVIDNLGKPAIYFINNKGYPSVTIWSSSDYPKSRKNNCLGSVLFFSPNTNTSNIDVVFDIECDDSLNNSSFVIRGDSSPYRLSFTGFRTPESPELTSNPVKSVSKAIPGWNGFKPLYIPSTKFKCTWRYLEKKPPNLILRDDQEQVVRVLQECKGIALVSH